MRPATDKERAAPVKGKPAATDNRNHSTLAARRANKAPERRWPVGASVGELIERARRPAP